MIVDRGVRTGLTVVLARPDDRAILTFPGAIAAMTAERVEAGLVGARPARPRVLVLSADRRWCRGWPTLLRAARAGGATTSVDPNWDPAQRWDGGLRELLRQVDVLLPNAVEACRLAGVEDPSTAAARLAALGPLVAVKLGAEGAVAAPAGGGGELVRAPRPSAWWTRWTPSAPETRLTPACSAPSWTAGALDGALAFACACGTLSMRAAGGTAAQPTLAEARAVTRQS